jgi:hypothetical protein
MDKQTAARVVHVLAPADVDVLQRIDHIQEPARMHVEAEAPQQAAEDDEVGEETGHVRCDP